jgi:NADH-quinone oxidoreductase subunit A
MLTLAQATDDYLLIAIMVVVALGMAGAILLLTHVITPLIFQHNRYGEIKHGTYESGVDPVGDTRRRFNVRFYLVAVLFLIFDVDIIFIYPFAVLFKPLVSQSNPSTVTTITSPDYNPVVAMSQMGYDLTFFLGAISFFFVLLVLGVLYEWRKGIFKWA